MGSLRDLINSSFRLNTVLGQNAVADANMLSNALYALDTMQDSWSNEKLMIYSIKPYIFYTNQNQQQYTMGPANDNPGSINFFQLPFINAGTGYTNGTYNNVPLQYVTSGAGSGAYCNIVVNQGQVIDCQVVQSGGYCGINYSVTDQLTVANTQIGGTGSGFIVQPGDVTLQTNWVIPRPMKIEKAYTIWQTNDLVQQVDIPISLLTMEQYASISVKQTTSTFAFSLYDDNAYPVRNLTLFPIPQQQVGIRFWLRQPLIVAEYNQLDVPIDYPPGYERAYRFNLAVELAAEYGKPLTEEVKAIAVESKQALARLNQAPRYKMGDGSLSRRRGPGRFNWITGGYGWNFLA